MSVKFLEITGVDKKLLLCDTGYKSMSHAVHMAFSLGYLLRGESADYSSPDTLASTTGKIIYAYDSVTSELTRYGLEEGAGCVVCYLDHNDKWWTVGMYNSNFEIVTVHSLYSELISQFNSILLE